MAAIKQVSRRAPRPARRRQVADARQIAHSLNSLNTRACTSLRPRGSTWRRRPEEGAGLLENMTLAVCAPHLFIFIKRITKPGHDANDSRRLRRPPAATTTAATTTTTTTTTAIEYKEILSSDLKVSERTAPSLDGGRSVPGRVRIRGRRRRRHECLAESATQRTRPRDMSAIPEAQFSVCGALANAAHCRNGGLVRSFGRGARTADSFGRQGLARPVKIGGRRPERRASPARPGRLISEPKDSHNSLSRIIQLEIITMTIIIII
jgi:hypothetical protein